MEADDRPDSPSGSAQNAPNGKRATSGPAASGNDAGSPRPALECQGVGAHLTNRDPEPARSWIERYNRPDQSEAARYALLAERLASVGKEAVVRPPFFCDNGSNITLGDGAFLNFNCIVLDVEAVTVGAGTAIGPCVQLLASDHPRDPGLRRQQIRYGAPITIGANVWIGGGAVILPGINIGDDAIVGAGSIVTRDVPAGRRVAGNPAREISSSTKDD